MSAIRFRSKVVAIAMIVSIASQMKAQVTFQKRAIEQNFQGACSVTTADIDQDGSTDILGAGLYAGAIGWWKNNDAVPPGFTKYIIDDDYAGASFIHSGDIDQDGDMDVAASGWDANSITVWWNQGGNPVQWIQQELDGSFHQAHEVKIGDIDGNGGLDIVAASAQDNTVAWWKNEGGFPVNWTKQVISTNVLGARSVHLADINGDGQTDVISAGFDDDDINVFYNGGGNPIQWTEQLVDGSFNGAHWVFSQDMDLDGDQDLLAAAYMGATIAIWYNDGNQSPQWTKFVLDGNLAGALSVVAGKIDDDAFPDVVAGGDIADDIRVYFNDGTGTPSFQNVIIDPSFTGAWPVHLADLDNDLDLDILAASSTLNDIYWWDNQLYTLGTYERDENPIRTVIRTVTPNPFSTEVKITLEIPETGLLDAEILSLNGGEIQKIHSGQLGKGVHHFVWDANYPGGIALPGGIYFIRINYMGKTETVKLIKR